MIYRCLQVFARFLVRTFYRVRVEGLDNFTDSGPLIICANHTFIKDMILIAGFAPRKMYWMAKDELFKIPLFGAFISKLGAFPVKRGSHDRDSIKKVYELLNAGMPIGIFPEGTRVLEPVNRPPFKRGYVSFAVNSGASILPVAIRYENGPFGRGKLFSKVVMYLGRLVTLDGNYKYSRDELDEISANIMKWTHEKIGGNYEGIQIDANKPRNINI